MRTLLTIVALGLLLLLPARSNAQTRVATVRAPECPLFGAPNAQSPVLASCERGERMAVLRIGDGWVKVRTQQGRVGFVSKAAVVPGVWNLARADSGRSERVSLDSPRSPAMRASASRRTGGDNNLTAFAGLAVATNTYSFAGGGTRRTVGSSDMPLVGLDTAVDWWPHANAGAHGRLTSLFGTTGGAIPGGRTASRVPAAMDRVEIDGLGRMLVRPGDVPLRLVGGAGLRIHQLRVDPVVSEGEPIFMVGRSYRGLALTGRVETPVGGPDRVVFAGVEPWLGATVSEAQPGASGRPLGANGLALSAGGRMQTDRVLIQADVRYQTLSARFAGSGERFGKPVSGASTQDRSLVLSATAVYRF